MSCPHPCTERNFGRTVKSRVHILLHYIHLVSTPPTSSTSAPSSPTDTVDIHVNLTQAKPIFLPLFSCCRQLWRQGVCQISGKCHGHLLCTRCFCCPLESLEGQTTAVEPVAWNPTTIRVEGLEAAVQAILVLEVFESYHLACLKLRFSSILSCQQTMGERKKRLTVTDTKFSRPSVLSSQGSQTTGCPTCARWHRI